MKQVPPIARWHGFAFNWKQYDRRDCKSTWTHFNPTGETHGLFNGSPSHVGQLYPIVDDSAGNASYAVSATRPTLYSGINSVAKRSMVVYESPDDFGTSPTVTSQYNGSMGREIACCNVQLFRVGDYEGPQDVNSERDGRLLDEFDDEGVEVLSMADFRELFGEDFDPANWEEDAI